MANERQQWVDLDEIIYNYIDRSEQSIHKFSKLWHIAFSGMEQLGLDFFNRIKSVKLKVEANQTVYLPNDFLNYTKVGVLNSKGEVVPLKLNKKQTFYADLSPDRLTKASDSNVFNYYNWNSPMFYNFWSGDAFINLYGLPSGGVPVGEFNIDIHNGVILLNPNFTFDYIILEYLSSPEEGGKYYVPIQFKEAMIAWLAWKDIQNMPTTSHFNLGDKRDRKQEFYNERRLANARFNPFYFSDAYEWNLENQRMTVKA
jgi:hypothetical protein